MDNWLVRKKYVRTNIYSNGYPQNLQVRNNTRLDVIGIWSMFSPVTVYGDTTIFTGSSIDFSSQTMFSPSNFNNLYIQTGGIIITYYY